VDSLATFLQNFNSRYGAFKGTVALNESMAKHTSFRTGGPADVWIQPVIEDFPEKTALFLESARSDGIPVFILGGGANLVVSDEGIRGIVLDMGGYIGEIAPAELPMLLPASAAAAPPQTLSFRAGTPIDTMVDFAAKKGLAGLEFLAGMPGSLGGAVWMNARCYDRELSDVIHAVQVLDRNGVSVITPKKEEFSYKKSPFQGKDSLILAVSLKVESADPREIGEKAAFYRKDREEKGHYRYPSAGSVFKNTRAFGKPAGQIIDELGLKGLAVGDAQVAPWHGNIIINRGNARSDDILTLVETLERRVKEALGLELEREVLFTGNFHL
jgi:UDP-N-acetylmuramate dehydrogenase